MLEALAVEAELASQAAERAKEAASAKRRLAQARSRSARASRASSRQDVTNSNVSVVEEVQAIQPAELPIRERGGGLLNFFSFNNSAPPRQEIREEQMNYQVHASADAEDSRITVREARAMKEVSERDRQLEEVEEEDRDHREGEQADDHPQRHHGGSDPGHSDDREHARRLRVSDASS